MAFSISVSIIITSVHSISVIAIIIISVSVGVSVSIGISVSVSVRMLVIMRAYGVEVVDQGPGRALADGDEPGDERGRGVGDEGGHDLWDSNNYVRGNYLDIPPFEQSLKHLNTAQTTFEEQGII